MLPGPARSYAVDALAAAGGTATLTASGPEGDLVVSLLGAGAAPGFLPLHAGTLLVAPPLTVVVERAVPAGGQLTKEIAVPPLALGHARLLLQGAFFDARDSAFLASGSALLVLGP